MISGSSVVGDAEASGPVPAKERTLAVVLGASEWPYYPDFHDAPSFRRSAHDVAAYLVAPDGLHLPRRNVKALIDSFDDAPEILRQIRSFIRDRRAEMSQAGSPATDLLLYYVGHGGFGDGDTFFLSIRATDENDPLASSITAESIGRLIRDGATGLRNYLVLDCCFAASASKVFMSGGPMGVAEAQLRDVLAQNEDAVAHRASTLPAYGTALLCASGPREPAKAPPDLDHTMFTGGLLEVLREGNPRAPAWLSLDDIQRLVRARLEARFANKAVLPQVHVPQQRLGRVDLVPLFRNPAHPMRQPTPRETMPPTAEPRQAVPPPAPWALLAVPEPPHDGPEPAHRMDKVAKPVLPVGWIAAAVLIICGASALVFRPMPIVPLVAVPVAAGAVAQVDGMEVRIVAVRRSGDHDARFVDLDYSVTTGAGFSRHDPAHFVQLVANGVASVPTWTSTSAVDLAPHSRQDILVKFALSSSQDKAMVFRFGEQQHRDLRAPISD